MSPSTIETVVSVIVSVIESLLPLLPAKHQVKALDGLQEWMNIRRKNMERHQARLDARKR